MVPGKFIYAGICKKWMLKPVIRPNISSIGQIIKSVYQSVTQANWTLYRSQFSIDLHQTLTLDDLEPS